jgi:membrane protease YdiL (CAAX protease family)
LRTGVTSANVGLQIANWPSAAIIGLTAGSLLVLLQRTLLRGVRLAPSNSVTNFAKWSASFWVAAFAAGAFAEELWIAFCLVAMRATGHLATTAVAATAIVFACQHLGYGYRRAVGVAARGACSALLFLWTGSLIPTALFHFIGDLGSIYGLRKNASKSSETRDVFGDRESGDAPEVPTSDETRTKSSSKTHVH